ncbi:hypothetical protein ANCCEY_11285 [Ancylostoma ceylanicum]|uniref:DNA-directed RNA polymerases I and III subunit RPAC1 n=1 Tax=Ancylostoma ceylanicum TaxID=53326 RepID=A0A0D6LPP1_9BILA|nr:hypothetical protein ANCCEY_11285 [Ancylostoma ceylanicum]
MACAMKTRQFSSKGCHRSSRGLSANEVTSSLPQTLTKKKEKERGFVYVFILEPHYRIHRHLFEIGDFAMRLTNLLRENPQDRPCFTDSSVYLSVVVPAMNEQERLPKMLDECLEYLVERRKNEDDFTFEVLVVDDGSTDRTADIGVEYGRKHNGVVRVIKLEKNLGKGGAVRSGVLHSSGKLILFADADGATKFSDIERLEKGLLRMSGGPPVDESFPAVIVFPVLHVERWAFDVELIYLCEKWRIPVLEVSVTWHEVEGSKIVPVWSWLQMGRDLILIWFRYRVGIWTDEVSKCDSEVADEMGGKRSAKTKAEPMDTYSSASNEIRMEEERVLNTYDDNSDYALTEAGPFDVAVYCKGIEVLIIISHEKIGFINVEIVNDTDEGMSLDFDLINVEAPIANALRRVLLAEVPTMAFEKIYLYQNTSVIQDEVLCHRLGLLPIKVDPRKFLMPTEKVTCTRNRNAPSTATEPHQLYHQSSVYSRSFKWIPCGDQEEQFASDPPRIVFDDILVAKLRPGQQIEANCHAVKGIGRDHAKFSPVATASYRLLPTIRLLSEVRGEAAVRLKESFSEGVIELKEKDGEKIAVVADARRDTCSRNVFRHDDLASVVELGRKKNHFIFSVESTGALKSAELVVEACKASDFVQQLVLFMYSLGVFSGYYFYTKITTPETVKVHEFEEFREETDKVITELRLRVELMESALKKAGVKVIARPPPPAQPSADSAPVSNANPPQQDSSQKTNPRFPRVSSLPVDAASNVVLKGEARKSI